MNKLTQFLVDSILKEETLGTVALFGGGFKPPTKGHLEVVLQGLKDNPDVQQVYILVGSGERNGVTQEEAVTIWKMYQKFIPVSTQIITVQSPFSFIKDYLTDHPDEKVYIFIGARAGNEEDEKDVAERSKFAKKYSENAIPVEVSTTGGVSGTKARQAALSGNQEEFLTYFPDKLTDTEKEQIIKIISDVVKENLGTFRRVVISGDRVQDTQIDLNNFISNRVFKLNYPYLQVKIIVSPVKADTIVVDINGEGADTVARKIKDIGEKYKMRAITKLQKPMSVIKENATYSKDIDIAEKLAALTNHMRDKGYKIDPLPVIEFINGDTENARDFFGKTAYYDPNEIKIVLYTEGRHPKDIVRSFAHEMIHHVQNLEGRLNGIQGTNTTEDDNLQDIEKEAYLNGNISFRNWTDSLQEKKSKDPFGLNQYARELAQGLEEALNENPSEVQKKKININFELWTGRKISEDIILAMSPDSQGVFELGDNIEKYTGLSLKDAKKYNESPDDAYIYGLVNTMNDGQDIFFWTNGTRLAGNAKKYGAWPATIEQLAHEGLHLARAILAKSIMGDKFPTGEWPSMGEQDNDTIEEEELTTSVSFVIEQIAPSFIEMATVYVPELKNQSIAENSLNEGRYDSISRQLANYTIKGWKDDQEYGEPSSRLEFEVGPGKDLEYGDLEFLYNAVAVFAGVNTYKHNGYAKPISSEVGIQFSIPTDMLPQSWERIYMDLISTIRHEIEHLTQSGKNVKPGKEMAPDYDIRTKLKQSIERGTDYFKLDKEVDANLHGLYLKAKKLRKPFDKVVDSYLKYDLNLSLDQIEDVKNAWRPRLKALSLPLIENEEMPESSADLFTIYLDMDGVIVNFDKQFEKLTGMGPREFESNFGKEKFWDKITKAGVGFWRSMEWMPGGQALYNRVSKQNHFLLSAPSQDESSKIGKRMWRRDNTPNTRLILSAAKNKPNYADKSNILIDDRKDTIDAWKAKGGIGILYTSASQVMDELDKLGL